MAKLYFKYGAMGSSKSAQVLITKFNYEELGMTVWLIKPAADHRDGVQTISSRIGLSAPCEAVAPAVDLVARYRQRVQEQGAVDVIISDESQFFTPAQIDQLRYLVDEENLPVLCFGLRTDFLTHFFPGSQRLMELADSISEIKNVCSCGAKATVNARLDAEGHVLTAGDQVLLGGNDRYIAMCHRCWKRAIRTGATVAHLAPPATREEALCAPMVGAPMERPEGPILRPATPAEAAVAAKLAAQLYEADPAELTAELAEAIADPAQTVLLAWVDGTAVAFAHVTLRHDYVEGAQTSPVGYLEGIYVAPPHRRRGLARAMVDAGRAWAKAQGCQAFASDCQLNNTTSQAFHRAVGFAEVGRIVCYLQEW